MSATGTRVSCSTWCRYVTGSTSKFWLNHQVWGCDWELGGQASPSFLRLTQSVMLSKFWKRNPSKRACPRLVSDVCIWPPTVLRCPWQCLEDPGENKWVLWMYVPQGDPCLSSVISPWGVLSSFKSQISQITRLFGVSPNPRKASQSIPGACAPHQSRKESKKEKQRTDPWLISPFQRNGEFPLNSKMLTGQHCDPVLSLNPYQKSTKLVKPLCCYSWAAGAVNSLVDSWKLTLTSTIRAV